MTPEDHETCSDAELRSELAQAREDFSRDVNALSDKASTDYIKHRVKADRMKNQA